MTNVTANAADVDISTATVACRAVRRSRHVENRDCFVVVPGRGGRGGCPVVAANGREMIICTRVGEKETGRRVRRQHTYTRARESIADLGVSVTWTAAAHGPAVLPFGTVAEKNRGGGKYLIATHGAVSTDIFIRDR